MKEIKCTAISSDVVMAVYNHSDLSLAAKGLFILMCCGCEDVDFSDPEQAEAFEELHNKGYLKYDLSC